MESSELYPQRPLEDLVDIYDSMRVPVKKADRKSGPYPYYGASGVADYVDSYIFNGEYLLLAEDGENLKTQNTPIAFLASGKFWVNNHAYILQANSSSDTRFLSYALQIADVNSYLSGSTRPKLTQGDMKRIPVYAPESSIQKAIAHILGSLDDRIELNRQMNETLEAMAQALFKSWFVDFDPVIDNALASGKEIPEELSEKAKARAALGDKRRPLPEDIRALLPDGFTYSEELGWIPKGWKVAVLKSLTTKIGSGATPRGGQKVYQENGVALIRSQNVYDSEFRWAGLAHITEEAAMQLGGVTVEDEDVLLNITGASILRTCVVIPDVLPARVNQHVAIIRAKPGIPSRYLHLHLLQQRTKDYLIGMNAGGSREAVTKGHIESVPTLCPNRQLLEHFQKFIEPIFSKKNQLETKTRILSSARDTLLPKLLSGELRIPDAEKMVERIDG